MARIYDSSGFLHGRKDGVFRSEYFICFLDDSNGSFKFVNEWFKDKNKWELAVAKAKWQLAVIQSKENLHG